MGKYVGSVAKLASELDIDYDKLRKEYQVLDGFPRKVASGWPVQKCSDFIEAHLVKKQRAVTGINTDLRREKLSVEIDILRDKRDRERGLHMPVDDVRAMLAKYAGFVRGSMDNFVQYVAAEMRDPVLVKKAEAARDTALNTLREAYE